MESRHPIDTSGVPLNCSVRAVCCFGKHNANVVVRHACVDDDLLDVAIRHRCAVAAKYLNNAKVGQAVILAANYLWAGSPQIIKEKGGG